MVHEAEVTPLVA